MLDFQQQHGLPATGSCDEVTWSTLIEAGWTLGDRLLMVTAPNVRGEDVAELQRLLARLGFDCGRVDGIFGPDTATALCDFQRNAGLPDDGVCGSDTVAALEIFRRQTGAGPGVVMVRESSGLTTGRRTLGHLRIVIGEFGGLGALARQITTALRQHSAAATSVGGPDPYAHAQLANRYRADVYIGFEASAEDISHLHHYSVPGFESQLGRALSDELVASSIYPWNQRATSQIGTRLPILRETRMPAVLWKVGPTSDVVSLTPTIVRGVIIGVERWVQSPHVSR